MTKYETIMNYIENEIGSRNIKQWIYIKKLYIKDILIGNMRRYYLKNPTNNKFMRISISCVNNDDIKKEIYNIINEIKD